MNLAFEQVAVRAEAHAIEQRVRQTVKGAKAKPSLAHARLFFDKYPIRSLSTDEVNHFIDEINPNVSRFVSSLQSI